MNNLIELFIKYLNGQTGPIIGTNDGAIRVVITGNPSWVQMVSGEVINDSTTALAVYTDVLIPVNIVTVANNARLQIEATVTGQSDMAAEGIEFAIFLDGVQVGGGAANTRGVAASSAALSRVIAVPVAGAHTVQLRWRSTNVAAQATVNAQSQPNNNHGTLTVTELSP